MHLTVGFKPFSSFLTVESSSDDCKEDENWEGLVPYGLCLLFVAMVTRLVLHGFYCRHDQACHLKMFDKSWSEVSKIRFR